MAKRSQPQVFYRPAIKPTQYVYDGVTGLSVVGGTFVYAKNSNNVLDGIGALNPVTGRTELISARLS